MRVLGVIPARGGSKGIARKNLAPLAGRPLLAYTADAVRASRRLTRTIVSTEDPVRAPDGRRSVTPPSPFRVDAPVVPVLPGTGELILITSRTAAAARCDQILVLDGGKVVERGTHRELSTRRGFYSELWKRQNIEQELATL